MSAGNMIQPMGTPPGVHRRPPRKSTLTQQQKNQKRQRATQDQLITLEVEFEKNPTPTAVVRERIAQDINMTERSVQIWFQNRRAKIKNLVKKSIENGEDSNDIPDSMRRYLAMQAMETGKSLGRDFMMPRFGAGNLNLSAFESPSNKVVIQHFTCRSLSVGSWRRIGQSAMDLVIFYSPEKETVTYYINNDSAGYKIEYSFDFISNITLNNGDPASGAEGASQSGAIVVELNRPPRFFMDSSGSGGFYEVGDFTEDQQATKCLRHELGGQAKVLSGQLAKLVALESFYNRHRKDPFSFAHPVKPVSMLAGPMHPPSPPVHRPASQPNHFLDDTQLTLMHEPVGMAGGLHPSRGHKRQRSRSVPVAIDWSMMRNPMTSFLSPPDMHPISPYIPSPDILAPVPIYNTLGANSSPMPLSINTSTFPTDFSQFPMSATTAPSPSDFGTPAFFSAAPGQDGLTATEMSNPFGSSSLVSSMPDASAGPQSSMHSMGGNDPVIANQSPPLSSLGHGPNENELYGLGQDGNVLDDGLSFDWEPKQPMMTLPMRPTNNMDDQQSAPVAFLDPSTLSNNPM
jgi:Homeodomain